MAITPALPTAPSRGAVISSRKILRFGQADLGSRTRPALDAESVHLWVLKTSALREILALYTGLQPAQIQFEEYGQGKPRLLPSQNTNSIYFNRTHSADFEVIAVTRRCEVGVDIEELRPFSRMDAFLERFAFDSERERIQALAEPERLHAFFELWTAKEAWCKARAESIFHALAHYEWDPRDPSFEKLEIEAGYVGYLYLLEATDPAF